MGLTISTREEAEEISRVADEIAFRARDEINSAMERIEREAQAYADSYALGSRNTCPNAAFMD